MRSFCKVTYKDDTKESDTFAMLALTQIGYVCLLAEYVLHDDKIGWFCHYDSFL